MFAIIETGGKQYRVEQGLEFKVELLQAEPGTELNLDKVLLIADSLLVVIGLIGFKKKRRNDFHKKTGHRQDYTSLKVKTIQA